jgi:hypothetical protein
MAVVKEKLALEEVSFILLNRHVRINELKVL